MADDYNWRSFSDCYFCFYQQFAEWQGFKEHHPDLFEKAKEYESGKMSESSDGLMDASLKKLNKWNDVRLNQNLTKKVVRFVICEGNYGQKDTLKCPSLISKDLE